MTMRSRLGSAALLLALGGGVTACGSGGDGAGIATAGGGAQAGARTSPTAGPTKDPRDLAVEFAQCMREHGVAVADPDDRGTVTIGGDDVDERAMQAAQEACKDKAPALGVGARGLDAAAQERMLRFARCMREHGVDLPDPGADGGLRAPRGENGLDPESEEFRAAEQACKPFSSGGNAGSTPGGAAPGSTS